MHETRRYNLLSVFDRSSGAGLARRHIAGFAMHALDRHHPLRQVARRLSWRVVFQIHAPADVVTLEQESNLSVAGMACADEVFGIFVGFVAVQMVYTHVAV